MHIALGYNWFPTSAGYHFERAFQALGHTVTYVGLPGAERAGYDSRVSVSDLVARWPANQPDVYVWIDPAGPYFPPGIERLSIPTACYLIDVHLGHWRQAAAAFFDAVFVAQKDRVDDYRRTVGHDQVRWLPLAAAADVHRDWHIPRTYDVGFVGNLALAHRRTARARRLQLISGQFSTNDFQQPYLPAAVGQVYSQSRIVFNTSIAGDVTMRVFEGSACGALVVTDATANGLGDLFDIGHEIVTYTDDADLLQKIEYYLGHEFERAAIAERGQKRTLSEHTYLHRAQTLLEAVTAPSFRQAAPMRTASPQARWQARRSVLTHLHMSDTLLDEARARSANPLQRVWAILPALLRKILL